MSLSQSSVAKLYATVIDDVIGGVREFFIDEGVDEQVLLELRHSWELKLKSSKAIETAKPDPEPHPPHLKVPPAQQKQQIASTTTDNQPSVAIPVPSNHFSKTISIQIAVPGNRNITIDVPSSALEGNKLETVITGPLITATMALPVNLATTLLQQHVNAALQGQQTSGLIPMQNQPIQNVQSVQTPVSNGTTSEASQRQTFAQQDGVSQVDGMRDSSDEDDEEDDNEEDDVDDDDDDKDDDEDPDGEDDAIEEEPLNSNDDVSEDEPIDMFETDNVVVCQFDKISRSRNRWKFYLKDGIMNLGGKDFVFQKSSGDAEW